MGSDYAVVDRVSYAQPLTFGLSLNHQYSPFKDALKNPQNYQEQVNSQRYFGCFSYLSYHGNFSVHNYSLEPAFIHKRNERERQRVRCVNEGYARLREHLPQEFEDKRLSKVETLRAAINYIKHLQNLLEVSLPQENIHETALPPVSNVFFFFLLEKCNKRHKCMDQDQSCLISEMSENYVE
uniref:BHLH domain-containing protein n=1 Tax=Cyprinus carpio TaxID=7962 RepID=A0A8C2H441_CYPCA